MTIKEYAIAYFKAGVTVFPVVNYKKFPALKTWKEYQNKKPTLAEVEKWFSHDNITGILALCGEQSNITVVDDDDYKTGNPLDIESPLESTTTSGGRHIYFRYSPEVENQNVRTNDQEFEIQNNGKLVMMPPSKAISKKTGKPAPYKWLKQHHDIKTLPILTSDFTAKYQTSIKQSAELTNLLEVDLGQQHTSLRSIINKFLFQTPEEDWDIKVYPVILATAEKYNPPHPQDRVQKLWQDCTRFVKTKKQSEQQPLSLFQVSQYRKVERNLEKKAPSTGFPGLDFLIKGFIPGHLYVMSGDTNVGKTSVSANFAVNVAENGGKVLYIALEPDNTVIDYLNCVYHDISYGEIEEYDDYASENISVYTKQQIRSLEQMISLIKNLPRYDLIIIDHIGYFTSGSNKSVNQAQGDAMKQLVQLAKRNKSAVMIIAHLRKDTGDFPSINDISGSGSFKQDATEVMIVTRDKDDMDERNVIYENTGSINILKSKVGGNGFFKIRFKESSAKIYDDSFYEKNMKLRKNIQDNLIASRGYSR